MSTQQASPNKSEPQVLITRDFDAPRELVFQAWTDHQHLHRWFAPKGCTIEFRKLEFREGGSYLSCIRNPQYPACWCTGVYREIVAPERIVFTMGISNEQGQLLTATQTGMDAEWPQETVLTVTFADLNGRTRLILHQTVSEALAKKTGAYPSWLQMLDRLAVELAKDSAAASQAVR